MEKKVYIYLGKQGVEGSSSEGIDMVRNILHINNVEECKVISGVFEERLAGILIADNAVLGNDSNLGAFLKDVPLDVPIYRLLSRE